MKPVLYLISLSLLVIFTACQSSSGDNGHATVDIPTLEKNFIDANTAEAAQALLNAYEGYIEANPDDVDNNSSYLSKAANIHYAAKRYETAVDILRQALHNYPKADNAGELCLRLGNLYENELQDSTLARTVWQSMAQSYPAVEGADLAAKTSELAPIGSRMNNMLEQMTDPNTGKLRFPVANAYINSAELLATITPQLTEAPYYLFKSGEIANYLSMHERALNLYQRIEEDFPNYDKAGKSLFMRAFITEENLQDKEGARALYQEFINKYPSDDFVEHAQVLLENLDKTNEEILQQFEQ